MLRSALCATALCLGAACAQAAEQPVIAISVPDIPRSIERFWATPLGRLWQDPQLASLRLQAEAGWAAVRAEAQDQGGIDLQELIYALQEAGFRLSDVDLATQRIDALAWVDAGPLAERLMSLAAALPPLSVAGADQAVALPAQNGIPLGIARFGSRLVLAGAEQLADPAVQEASSNDLDARLDSDRLTDLIAGNFPLFGQDLPQGPSEPVWTIQVQITEDGVREIWDADAAPSRASQAIDTALLAHLPANTLLVSAHGFHGTRAYELVGEPLIKQAASLRGQTTEQMIAQIEAQLAMIGLAQPLPELVAQLQGTAVFACTQGIPFPTANLILPTSPAMDHLLSMVLQGQFQHLAPAIGASIQLQPPLPLPLQIGVGRTQHYWVIGTDPRLVHNIINDSDGGYLTSAPARSALAVDIDEVETLLTCHTSLLMQTLMGYAPMLAMLGNTPPELRGLLQQSGTLLAKLAGMVGPGYVVSGPVPTGYRLEAEGLLTPLTTYALVLPTLAAIAIPHMLESRESAHEKAALAGAQSGLFPAQVQFQAAAYVDDDQDGTGEYGFPAELAGRRLPSSGMELQLLPPEWHSEQPLLLNDWYYKVWLPNGPDVAIADSGKRNPETADLRELYWVAYIWPGNGSTADMMYAIDHSGQLFEAEFWGIEPLWNELYGGGAWGTPATWTRVDR